jgi:hypothetical protein
VKRSYLYLLIAVTSSQVYAAPSVGPIPQAIGKSPSPFYYIVEAIPSVPIPIQSTSANQLRATGRPDHKLCGQDDAPGRISSVFQDVNEHLNG